MVIDPCGICGSNDVRVELRDGPRLLGEAVPRKVEVRFCENRECRSNGRGPRLLGDAV